MSLLRPTPRTRGAARRQIPALRLAVAALAVATALAGCDIRLETPAPTAPAPDATETVRSRTVDDALELAAGARAASTSASAEVQAVLAQVADFSAQHAVELGGTYDSGLATPSPSTSTPAAEPTALPDASQVLTLLATADRTAAADAADVPGGALARLLASIAASRAGLVARLAAALGVAAPVAGPAVASPSASASAPTDSATATPTAGAPGTATPHPADVPTADRTGIVAAEDQAGYGFEVLAAKLDDPSRSSARAAAAAHRARAEAWATEWALDGTATDPRRATYALPAGLDDPATARALAQTLELGLTTTYASAVADSARASRPELIAALLVADADAAAWGVPTTAFPGLPERVG
ncbi:MAG TPA: DUF4439 domain-containing protein [Cellulomonas sp.]|uniref:DUF4439 domain-containing protein n=1 Tax=Cellulomonas sp. TaxID=40001 RepID=UPI002E333BBE|nr:DUF4439 domain-containing protein [Cellulomonas sp.]HEX5333631.1 DUF4439 domain-containing protein [Cellulomonas sp.]